MPCDDAWLTGKGMHDGRQALSMVPSFSTLTHFDLWNM